MAEHPSDPAAVEQKARHLAEASVCATLAATDEGQGVEFVELMERSRNSAEQAVRELRSRGLATLDGDGFRLTPAGSQKAGLSPS